MESKGEDACGESPEVGLKWRVSSSIEPRMKLWKLQRQQHQNTQRMGHRVDVSHSDSLQDAAAASAETCDVPWQADLARERATLDFKVTTHLLCLTSEESFNYIQLFSNGSPKWHVVRLAPRRIRRIRRTWAGIARSTPSSTAIAW